MIKLSISCPAAQVKQYVPTRVGMLASREPQARSRASSETSKKIASSSASLQPDLLMASSCRGRPLPTIYPFAFYTKAGGLVSYGFDAVAQFQQGAAYVDKLLRGARPAELPVQFPTKFELVLKILGTCRYSSPASSIL
jgi:hypothetical protein